MDEFLHMIASLTDFVWEFFICFLAVAVYHLIVRFAELGASPFRMFRSSRYYYLVFVHEKAVELLKKGKSNEEIRAELRSFRFPFQSNTPTTPKAVDDMSFVGRVLGNDDILDIYIIKYNFEFDDFRKLEASMNADSVENSAKSKVSALLIDDSPANVDKVTAALVKWHTEPFVPERLERKKISAGENEAYYYVTLESHKITKEAIPLKQFVDAMLALKAWHPEINVVRSKSSLSDHTAKPTTNNGAYSAIDQEVERFSKSIR